MRLRRLFPASSSDGDTGTGKLSSRARRIVAVSLALGVVYLCLPRPGTGWVLAHLHKEDGDVFLAGAVGDASAWTTYTGYLHVPARLTADVLSSLLPPEYFSIGIGIVSAVLRGAIALLAFVALRRYFRHWGWALAAAMLVLIGGVGQQEALGNLTNWRWFFDAAVVLGLIGVFRRPTQAILAAVLVLGGVLADPLALLAAPIALWRLWSGRGWERLAPAVYLVGFAVHVAVLQPSDRPIDLWLLRNPLDGIAQIFVRGVMESFLGENGSQVALNVLGPAVFLVAVVPLLVIAMSRTPRRSAYVAAALAIAGCAVLGATLSFATPAAAALQSSAGIGQLSRYAVAPSLLIGMALLMVASWWRGRWGRIAAIGLVAAMALGAAADLRGDPWNTRGPQWADSVADAQVQCSGPTDVVVPLTPQGTATKWEVTLPCTWLGG